MRVRIALAETDALHLEFGGAQATLQRMERRT
jgi:hypothetical protein